MSQDNFAPDSSYPPFKWPTKFESQIPEHLLAKATPFEKHVMEELSMMRQADEWTVGTLGQVHEMCRKTNGKANRAEADIRELQQDKRLVVRGWRLFAAVCIGLTGVIGFLLSIYSALH